MIFCPLQLMAYLLYGSLCMRHVTIFQFVFGGHWVFISQGGDEERVSHGRRAQGTHAAGAAEHASRPGAIPGSD